MPLDQLNPQNGMDQTKLQAFRAQYPQYDGVPDNELAARLHQKFYSNVPVDQFNTQIGATPNQDGQAGPWSEYQNGGNSVFEVQGPDGQVYEIQAPDQATALKAFESQSQGPWNEYAPQRNNFGPRIAQPTQPTQLDALGRGAAQGFGIGIPDEAGGHGAGQKSFWDTIASKKGQTDLKAALKAQLSGDKNAMAGYNKGLHGQYNQASNKATAEYRAKDAAAKKAHGGYYAGGEIAGAIPSLLTGVGTMANVARGSGMLAKTAVGAIVGGAESGAYGFAQGEGGATNRAINAAKYALWGTVGGGVTPLLAKGVGTLAKKAHGATKGKAALIPGLTRKSQKAILKDVLTGDIKPNEIAKRFDELGENSMLLDLHPQYAHRGEQIVNSENLGRSVVADALTKRDAGAGGRLTQSVDGVFGQRVNVADKLDRLKTDRSAKAKPFYDKAFTEALPPSQEITSLLKTPTGKRALIDARKMARDKGFDINPEQLSVEGANLIKLALDDLSEAAARAGNKNKASVIGEMKNKVLSVADKASPSYATARKTAAEGFGLENAFERGRGLFGKRTGHPDFVKRDLGKMTPDELSMTKDGTRAALDDAVDWAGNPDLKTRTFFDATAKRQNLQTVVGADKANRLIKTFDAEKAFKGTSNQILGGSQTARRMDNPFKNETFKDGPMATADKLAGKTLNYFLRKHSARGMNKMAKEYGTALTDQGSVRDMLLDAIAKSVQAKRAGKKVDEKTQAILRSMLSGRTLAPLNPFVGDN